jgi:hypothetical protein
MQPWNIWRPEKEEAEEASPYCKCRIARPWQAAITALMISATVKLPEQPFLRQSQLTSFVQRS